jgi:hypothetical protein
VRTLALVLVAAVVATFAAAMSAAQASASELPPVQGLLSRWRAADLALQDGAPVASWADAVGGVTVSQPATARQPVFRSSVPALGGQPAVSFSRATGQWLTASAASGTVPAGYLAGVSGVTVFVVMTTGASTSAATTSWFASTGTSDSQARVLDQVTSSSQASIGARRLDTDALVTVNSTASAVSASKPYVLTGLLDFAGNQGRQYVNGSWTLAKALSGAGTVSATGSRRVAIGVNGSDANALDGMVSEVLVYRSALTPQERAQVHSYVQDTYGIVVSDYLSSPTPSTTTTTTTSPPPTTTTTTPPPPTTTTTTTAPPTTTTTSGTGVVPDKVAAPTVFAPSATLAASTTTTAVVTAKDAVGAPLPGAQVFLKFQATTGGGAASVGGVPLTTGYQGFPADSSGQVLVSYTTPPVLARGGRDLLSAANLKSGATSTDTTSYSFTTTKHWLWAPEPIGAPGSLPAGAQAGVAVTALDDVWNPVPYAQVCLSIAPTAGGGSATSQGKTLTAKYQCVTADSAGAAHVDYRAPDVLPATGMDVLNVRDTSSSLFNTASFHGYSFGQLTQVTLSPNPIAAPGAIAPGGKVTVTLTPRDQTGAQVAGATVLLWLETSSGSKATVGSYAAAPDGTTLAATPRTFLTHTTTKLTITYQTSKTRPASGTDRLYAQVTSADGTVTTVTTAEYTWGG